MVEVSIFCKSEKTSGQTIQPIKIKTVAFFYLIMAAYSSNIFCCFYCALDISSRIMKSLREVSIFQKLAKTEVKTFRPTKIEVNPTLAAQALNFYQGFYYALDIFSPILRC